MATMQTTAPRFDATTGSATSPAATAAGEADADLQLEPQLARLKREFIEDLWKGMCVVALVGVPISVSRSAISGWLPVYTSHVVLALLVGAVFLLRGRLSYHWLSSLFLGLLWAVGLPGVFSFGLISASTFWLVLSCYMASNLYSTRVGLVFAALTGVAILAAGAGYVSGHFNTAIPEAIYHRQISAWLTLLVATGAFLFLSLRSIGMHQRAVVDLMAHIQAKSREVSDLYDHAPCGYHSMDADGRLVRINQTELRWLGLTAAQALGRSYGDFLTPASRQLFRERFAQFLQTGHLQDAEFELLRADGSTMPVLVSATAVRDAQDRFVRSRTTVFDITERKKLEQRLDQLARTDALTGLSNRRDFNDRAQAELARCRRLGKPLSLLMVDIDHFKLVNDRHGHAVGDAALRQLADSCRHSLREIDLPARLGGEEFVALLTETTLPDALDAAERLRRHIEALEVAPQQPGPPVRLTVSIGVAELAAADRSHEDLMRRADQALYAAKREGRNRVVAAAV
jgi:diguanylate cyclase (GGDEF)-like protein/PAS domain S-box-containing protein